ncbi:MAG: hypothetical protein ACRDT4_17500 [Micromonosporaceae bacterium]
MVVERVTGSHRALHELARHLADHLDALTSGRSDGPPSLLRLTKLLAEEGFHEVRVPGCLHCGRTDSPLPARTSGGRLCQPCWKKATAKPCARCARLRPVQARTADGPVCARCAGKPKRACGRCGSIRRIHTRATDTTPDLCERCVRWRLTNCSACGKTKHCRPTTGGRMTCSTCEAAATPPRECCRCRRRRKIRARWPGGPVCGNCYETARANPRPCPACGQRRVLTGTGDDGATVCGPCAGATSDFQCVECGQWCEPFAGGRCARRVLRERVQQILAGPPADSPLARLAEALTTADNPRAVVRWLRGPTGHLLANLAATRQPLTHTALDRVPPSPGVRYLRSLLVHSGVLQPRQDYLERVIPWLDGLLADQPAHRVTIIRPYAVWDVLARARRRARGRPVSSATGGYLRRKITQALRFLTWLDEHGVALEDLTQGHLDRWLAEGTTTSYLVLRFVTWLRHRKIVGDLRVPAVQSRRHLRIGEDERWQQLRRCLHETTLPLHVRAAGALLLLYGNPITRTVRLTAADIDPRDDGTYITLDRRPALMPPALARLMLQLRDQDRPPGTLQRAVTTTAWLFPGRYPGEHREGAGFTGALAGHGIEAKPGRAAALMALAEQLPASILADLLGIHPHTAVHWVKLAKRDWTGYIAERAAPPSAKPQDRTDVRGRAGGVNRVTRRVRHRGR